jgi:predicted XRE-type DNA-binding protein
MSTTIRSSSGDVFKDLGFATAEAEDLRLRSELMIELKTRIVALQKSQTAVARMLDVQQPRVSNLLKGRIDLFSLDSLVEMLDRLGNRVDVTVKDKAAEIPQSVSISFSYEVWDEEVIALSNAIRSSLQNTERVSRNVDTVVVNSYALAA